MESEDTMTAGADGRQSDMEEFDIDPAFLERDRLRKSGIPVKIAKTERLLIRETIPSDIPDLYEIWNQGGMVRGTVPVLNTLDEETEFMEAYIRHAYLFYDFGLWTVIEKQSGQIIGQAGLFVSELLDDAVELGYLIGWPRRHRQDASGDSHWRESLPDGPEDQVLFRDRAGPEAG